MDPLRRSGRPADIGLLTTSSVPGRDFFSLANSNRSPSPRDPLRFDDSTSDDLCYLDQRSAHDACGHHHVCNTSSSRRQDGSEWYQISLGGSQGLQASLGKVIGPSFAAAEVPDVIANLIAVYVDGRHPDEAFIDTVRRIGIEPFKERVYAAAH